MPKLLKQNEVNLIDEEVDIQLTKAEEAAARSMFAPTGTPGDLSDGGRVNGVTLTPMQDGKPVQKGRANARLAWMGSGTETALPLGWNPDGTRHDGARPYLLKRYCLCCNAGGFRGAKCLNCVKNNCTRCNGSSDRKKVIPCFYLKKEDVPFPERFYGPINCFLPMCIRRGDRGFKTEPEMMMHARSRHKMEYQAHVETLAASRTDEVADLRRRLDSFMLAQSAPVPAVVAERPLEERGPKMTKAERSAAAKARWAAKRVTQSQNTAEAPASA